MTDKPRLIEVAFPLRQASLASVHEKNVRHGHISTLHIWPARRPLAACRAALLCTLLPDPGDPLKRQQLLDKIGGRVVTKKVKETDDDGVVIESEKEVVEDGVLAWGTENSPAMDEFRRMIREFYGGEAPKVLDPFAGGGAIPLEAMRLGCDVTASDLNPVAWFILKCTLDYPQQLAGKKWPLPDFVREWPDFVEDFLAGKIKKRKGNNKTHFTDPNQLQLLQLPEADLAWHVRAWGRWVLERSRADLAGRYPVVNDELTIAYLWARTARDKQPPYGRIPLLKTFWLCKKKGRRAALLPVPNADRSGVTFQLLQEADLDKPERIIREHAFLGEWEINADNFTDFLNKGTKNRAGIWSPCTGRPGLISLTMDDLERQGTQGLLDAQMTAVVVDRRKRKGKGTVKRYRLPVAQEQAAAKVEIEDIEDAFQSIPHGIPKEPIIEDAKRNTWCATYGVNTWDKLFTPRQLVSLAVFAKHIREASQIIAETDEVRAEMVGAYLICAFDKMLDYENTCTSWYLANEQITHLFNRFAIPIKWDFAEASPIGGASGSWESMVQSVTRSIDTCVALPTGMRAPKSELKSALQTDTARLDAVVTDPPYYEAIGYAVVMDFFYVWLRRMLSKRSSLFDDAFREPLSPKWNHEKNDGELVDDAKRFDGDRGKSKANYETGMARVFQRACANLSDLGRIVLVFANKDVEAWETLIAALIRGGAVVSASWPIQTEMPNRTRGISSAALSSSVWIVCRKRPTTAAAGWGENVLDQMKQTLFDPRETLGGRNILQYFFDLGIRGPDFMWAALGPALEAYSAHPFVKKTGGGILTVPEFLKEVRRLVLQFSLGELPGFKDIAAETQGRGESLELDPVTQYYLLHRAYFGFEPAPAGACILYANACGKNETELKVVWNVLDQCGRAAPGKPGRPRTSENGDDEEAEDEGKGNEYRLVEWDERASRESLGEPRGGLTAPLVDRLHRLMWLFQQNRTSEVQQLFDTWGLASERAFKPLLQAVRELALRDKQDTERRLVEALATQLKMNKRMVVREGKTQEEDLFSAVAKEPVVEYPKPAKKPKKKARSA
jgi:adenine-specific DNA methylase